MKKELIVIWILIIVVNIVGIIGTYQRKELEERVYILEEQVVELEDDVDELINLFEQQMDINQTIYDILGGE